MNRYQGRDMRKFIASIPKDEFARKNKEQHEAGLKRHRAFLEALQQGKCATCGTRMDEFNPAKPCVHWLTVPKGIKKKHIEQYLGKQLNFFGVQTYMRWLANTEKPLGNINDLKDEMKPTSFMEVTIKYSNVEWAFSIGETDLDGHGNSKVGREPHYHLQIKKDDRIVLRFNDCHIPFSDEDLMMIEIMKQMGDDLSYQYIKGDGMASLENDEMAKAVDNHSIVTDDFENATFHTQTLIEGGSDGIPMEVINKALEEQKKTGEPLRKLLQRHLEDAKFTTIITPGDGVPEMTKRSGGRGKKTKC